MLEMVVGAKGRGKTKYLLDIASKEIANVSGTVVYLDKNTGHMYELNRKIRLIDVTQYNIKSEQEFIGFILGLLSQDSDLETIIVDSFLKLACIDNDDVSSTLSRLDEISKSFNVKIVLSIGLGEDNIPAEFKDSITVSL